VTARPAVVLGLLWAGLSLARSLGRAGVDVTGVSMEPHEFGTRSRYLRRRAVVLADDTARRDERVLEVLRAAASDGKTVLFPERDAHVEFVLRNWDAVRELALVPLPDDPDVAHRLRRKDRLPHEAEQAGVPMPPTLVPDDEAAIRAADLRPPLLVKAAEGQDFAVAFGRKNFVARDVDEAVAAWRTAQAHGLSCVIQEIVPDAEDKVFSLFAYVSARGEPLATVVGRKVRQGVSRFGTSAVFELRDEPRVLDLGLRLLQSSGYTGFAHVELAHDARGDEFKLLEVNTRVPMWGGIAMTPRFDVARLAYEDLCGAEPRPAGTFEGDVNWVFLAKDLLVSLRMLRGGELRLGEFLGEYVGRDTVPAIFAADDPLPALASVAYLRAKAA
jgi:D-aspartate ligase